MLSNGSNKWIVKPLKKVRNEKEHGDIYYTLGHPIAKRAIRLQPFCVVKENVL